MTAAAVEKKTSIATRRKRNSRIQVKVSRINSFGVLQHLDPSS
jgi:hypothetical protein